LLGLSLDATEFHIAFGALQTSDREIALLTRPIFGILAEAATGVEIPASHREEGRVTKPLVAGAETGGEVTPQHLVRVRSSVHKPDSNEAFTAVQYRGYWFWVDDRDFASKRGMGFLMVLFTLASPGVNITPPVLTISKP
jgi:hypothetical protein